MKKILSSKIHRAVVTDASLHYVGSISIDQTLIEAAGLAPYEEVHIVDITNGARLHTYVIPHERDSGVVQINGAAAHLIDPGDLVIIMGYTYVTEDRLQNWQPKVVFVDDKNRIVTQKT